MFELLEFFFDEIGDLVGGAVDAITEALSDSAADAVPVDAVPVDALPVDAVPMDAGSGGADSFLAGTDGGISADRFDPKPVMGPWAP